MCSHGWPLADFQGLRDCGQPCQDMAPYRNTPPDQFEYYSDGNYIGVRPVFPAGSSFNFSATATGPYCTGAVAYTCQPNQGWTLNGQTCTRSDCTPPQVHEGANGACVAPCASYETRDAGYVCQLDCTKIDIWSTDQTIVYGTGTPPATGCLSVGNNFSAGASDPTKRCQVDISKATIIKNAGPGGVWSAQGGTLTGKNCAGAAGSIPDQVTPETPKLQPNGPEAGCIAKGMGYGTVNGTVVCTTAKEIQTPNEKTLTNPDGSKVKTQATTVCAGDNTCTTTTITTNTTAGGTSTSTTSTMVQNKNEFCAANVGSKQCGDATFDLGEPTGGGDLGTHAASGFEGITPTSLPMNMSCPADVQLPKGVVFSYAKICDGMSWIRPVILALAWLSAGLIVVGALRNG